MSISSSSSSSSLSSPNPIRSKHIIDTATTDLQDETEFECEPFFAHIPSLPDDQIKHLRSTGLLRRIIPPNNDDNNDDNDNESSNNNKKDYIIQLLRNKHSDFCSRPFHPKSIFPLPQSYTSLDSSRPWILYWTLHSLDLLSAIPDQEEKLIGVVHTIEACWASVRSPQSSSHHRHAEGDGGEGEGGGFGGGPHQIPHAATSYAAVQTLVIIAGQGDAYPNASELALDLLRRKREAMYVWFLSLRHPNPSSSSSSSSSSVTPPCGYRMHHDGEVDVRATYTLCAMASLLNILTESLTEGMMEYIISCQTFEGGFGGVPYAEAHGGYTFCALAALHILVTTTTTATIPKKEIKKEIIPKKEIKGGVIGEGVVGDTKGGSGGGVASRTLEDCEGFDTEALRGWLSRRQMGYEGGFQGRCNKLVDGCYSYWIGGAIAILDLGRGSTRDISGSDSSVGEVCDDGNDEKVDDSIRKNFDSGVFAWDDQVDKFGILRSTNDGYDDNHDADCMDTNENKDDYNEGGLSFDQKLLQRYILLCGQDVNGGLRDKPSKPRDFYHTCYNLSGLSVSQHVLTRQQRQPKKNTDDSKINNPTVTQYEQDDYNVLGATHPVYNLRPERVLFILDAFQKL
eukprot:CAMPEP_0198276034 /NCGR_PEP_ID=MMETSP1447-20131203/65096_1 /TAXON_ID=420782 /ORGANISM="Chaetoceros dichaeta, Strain CCMP1751" /LENGTH=624 /DNA_ID=CAMNT_0043970951 /DNA_START=43 /DNA_END=1917 /DNA_ORIENTATION=-